MSYDFSPAARCFLSLLADMLAASDELKVVWTKPCDTQEQLAAAQERARELSERGFTTLLVQYED
jgi:hypothetical protein